MSNTITAKTMRAVVFKGVKEVAVEDRPVPTIRAPTDAILRVTSTALCGSDLHYYRGHLKCDTGFICGHEFVGEVAAVGDDVKKFKVGDKVVVPFYTACGDCFYCVRGQASRCAKGELYGNSAPANTIDGGQAEYVRCPLADTTFVLAPTSIPEEMLVLMADIFPTGYFAAARYLKDLSPRDKKEYVAAVVGCGPVGLIAIAVAKTMVDTVYAIDMVDDRLEQAKSLGAIPINSRKEDPVAILKSATDGRGADVVLEVVGHTDALLTALQMIRPWGCISSVGVHTQDVNMSGLQLYGKNVTMAFGRCPVRSIFEEALAKLEELQGQLKFLTGQIRDMEDAKQAYEEFESQKVGKVVFKITRRAE